MDMTEPMKFEIATGKVKLSDAIRIGAKLRPQAYGAFFINGGSCALGAACEAIGFIFPEDEANWDDFERVFPGVPESIKSQVVYKNDSKNESRESIAEWLESQGL